MDHSRNAVRWYAVPGFAPGAIVLGTLVFVRDRGSARKNRAAARSAVAASLLPRSKP